MKIGIDAVTWNNRRGFGRFTRELLEALITNDRTNEYLFFTDDEIQEVAVDQPNVKIIPTKTGVSAMQAASSSGRRSIRDLLAMSREVWRHQVDLFFFPAVYSYFPIFNRAKIIVTLHDVIAEHHPELVFPNSRLKNFWKIKQNIAIRQADLILTVSDYSKTEIINYFNLPESKIRVISEAARSVFRVIPSGDESKKALDRHKLKPDDKFLLYVGGISPHKNLKALVDAFSIIVNSSTGRLKLVLVGDYKDDPFFSIYPDLKKHINSLDLTERVMFTGFIDDIDLAHFYNAAFLVVLPSLEEGFGLPAVEAMACGAPVAASRRGSLPEVLGKAGRFFDPASVSNMAETISGIIENAPLQAEMRRAGLDRAKDYLWNKAAGDLLKIFEDLYETR